MTTPIDTVFDQNIMQPQPTPFPPRRTQSNAAGIVIFSILAFVGSLVLFICFRSAFAEGDRLDDGLNVIVGLLIMFFVLISAPTVCISLLMIVIFGVNAKSPTEIAMRTTIFLVSYRKKSQLAGTLGLLAALVLLSFVTALLIQSNKTFVGMYIGIVALSIGLAAIITIVWSIIVLRRSDKVFKEIQNRSNSI
jgi:hypothetical protein